MSKYINSNYLVTKLFIKLGKGTFLHPLPPFHIE